jgi:hypothetical protein
MGLRAGVGVCALSYVALACGSARQRPALGTSIAPPAAHEATPSAVSGVVLDADEHWPLRGRIVEIGGRRAVTDEQGRFRIPDVPPRYDVRISEADGSWVTLYRGVERREPMLALHVQAMNMPHEHSAHVKVIIRGLDVSPLGRDTLILQVRSAKTQEQSFWSGNEALDLPSIFVGWDGPESRLAAEVVVVRRHYTGRRSQELAPNEVFAQHAMARQELMLEAGQTAQLSLELAPLPAFHVIVAVDEASRRVNWNTSHYGQQQVSLEYHWVFGKSGSVIYSPLVSAHGEPEYWIDGPPESEPARSLCLRLLSPVAFTQRCGARADQFGSLSLDAPPRLLLPSQLDESRPERRARDFAEPPLSNDSRFSWQGPAGVTRLRVEADAATATTPSYDVYASDSAITAAEFVGSHRFSRTAASYRVQLTHFGPFPSVDAAVDNAGIAARAPAEFRTSTSEEVPMVTVPAAPAGAVAPIVNIPSGVVPERAVPWAPCQYPVDTDIGCGDRAWASLTAINNRLRHFPEFAFDTHIHCVTNCAEALAFAAAEDGYAKTHPGYFASEPLDLPMAPPPPLPPDALKNEQVGPAGKPAAKRTQKK